MSLLIEKQEKAFLQNLIKKVYVAILAITDAIMLKKDEIDYMNHHMEDHKRDMDYLEINAMHVLHHTHTPQRTEFLFFAL
jgi:hypothetical protein